jgi:hypothetical protein
MLMPTTERDILCPDCLHTETIEFHIIVQQGSNAVAAAHPAVCGAGIAPTKNI